MRPGRLHEAVEIARLEHSPYGSCGIYAGFARNEALHERHIGHSRVKKAVGTLTLDRGMRGHGYGRARSLPTEGGAPMMMSSESLKT
jgi:hypothetical protein